VIIIDMIAVDTSSPSLGGGANRRKRRCATPSCYDLIIQWVISTKQ
jgi:hypothetical protein